ncbi:proline-, glutamic acid- and leucine-rich protein 1-like [Diabrotica undecimpunctata]|uniref:proline-, glutamic acid- and leucine-rich protein 1-like n=1 Tax=Diabrotica undecimpunctata TaxID=50387 RepID=UPI003B635D1D
MNKAFEIYSHNGPRDADIKKLNTLLSNSKTIVEGLVLLKLLFKHCSVEVLNENLINWLDLCLVKHSEHFTDLKLSLIEKFIEASFNNQELAKKISSEYLSKIIDLCLTSKSNYNEIEAAFDVLNICMKKYNSCTTHKTKIEAHILSFIEHSTSLLVKKAAVAFLYLQQTGNAGTKSNNYVTNFKTTVSKLCGSAHNLFDIFFQNKEIEQYTQTSQESFQLDIYLDGDVNATARSIKNIIIFLSVFIQNDFVVCKEIDAVEILNLIKRGIVIHHCISETLDKQHSSADYEFCILNTDIQVELLSLLRILIVWLRSNCLIFAFTISKILLDSLKRTQKCSCFNMNCVYHETVYIVLTEYINICQCSLNSHFQTDMIKCILNDIKPRRNEIALKKQSNDKKELYLKQKSTNTIILRNKENQYDIHKSKQDIENDEIICQLALSTLTALFKNSYLRVEKSLIHSIFSLIMNVFSEIMSSRIPHPYKSSQSQLKLHELLVACCEQETLTDFPIISMTLNILQLSSCSKSKSLAQTCQENLNVLEKICQPISTPFPTFSVQSSQLEYSNVSDSPPNGNGIEQVTNDNIDLTNINDEKSADSSVKVNIISNELTYSPDLFDHNKSSTPSYLDRSSSNNIASLEEDYDNFNKNHNADSKEDNKSNDAESDESFEPVLKKSKIEGKKITNSQNVSDGCKNNSVCEDSSDVDISFTDEVQDY